MSELLETILWLKRSLLLRPRTGALRGGLSQPATTGNSGIRAKRASDADSFPAIVKMAEIPEGMEAASAASWRIGKLPVLQDQTKLYEGIGSCSLASCKKRGWQMKMRWP
jgi:hypothetical protein